MPYPGCAMNTFPQNLPRRNVHNGSVTISGKNRFKIRERTPGRTAFSKMLFSGDASRSIREALFRLQTILFQKAFMPAECSMNDAPRESVIIFRTTSPYK